MRLFGKKKVVKEEETKGITVFYCNHYLLTSRQLQTALNEDEELRPAHYEIMQFPWVAEETAEKMPVDLIFVDEITDSKRDLEVILEKIKKIRPECKIIVVVSCVSSLTTRLINIGVADGYLMMPFQNTHVRKIAKEILGIGEEDNGLTEIKY